MKKEYKIESYKSEIILRELSDGNPCVWDNDMFHRTNGTDSVGGQNHSMAGIVHDTRNMTSLCIQSCGFERHEKEFS